MRRQVRQLSRAALAVAALASGCAHVAPTVTSPAGSPPSSVEAEAWAVSIALDGAALADSPSRAVVTLATRGRFHLNDDYPIHFVPRASSGVAFPRARIDRADGIRTTDCPDEASRGHACAASVPVAFGGGGAPAAVAANIGGVTASVGGELAFSACDDERCLIEKVAIAVAATSAPASR